MDWYAAVDIYCERTASGFWNEPFNALSNLAFVAAAAWAWISMEKREIRNTALRFAIILVFCIGVGSFLFHTYANPLAELGDVIPIWTFVAWFVLMSIRYFGGAKPRRVIIIGAVTAAIVAVVLWVMAGSGVRSEPEAVNVPGLLNGSEQYAPAIIALYAFVWIAYRRQLTVRRWIAAAAVVFSLSLVVRTVDLMLCDVWPIGTHFGWHLLNGTMIALLLQAMIRHLDEERR